MQQGGGDDEGERGYGDHDPWDNERSVQQAVAANSANSNATQDTGVWQYAVAAGEAESAVPPPVYDEYVKSKDVSGSFDDRPQDDTFENFT